MQETQMTDEQLFYELRSELAANQRIARLIKVAADRTELELFRKTKTTADHAMLVHLTASASAVQEFVNQITAEPKASNKAE